jgi:hypothetical protein
MEVVSGTDEIVDRRCWALPIIHRQDRISAGLFGHTIWAILRRYFEL